MTARDEILQRIRAALATPAAAPAAPAPLSEFMPPSGKGSDDRLALFQLQARDLRAEFVLVADLHEMMDKLRALAGAEGWKKVAFHAGEMATPAACSLGLPLLATEGGYEVNEMESCDASITQCDALVAQTGSVMVSSRSTGGRGITVLPPHHVVLARRDQLVGDLTEAFALIRQRYGPSMPSMVSFITGPSRTGDIERILVLGAHGPKKLTIFCV